MVYRTTFPLPLSDRHRGEILSPRCLAFVAIGIVDMTAHGTTGKGYIDADRDGEFPYYQTEKATDLIKNSRAISPNASFFLLDRICRPISPKATTLVRQYELINEWEQGFEHPLKKAMLRCAESLIQKQPLPLLEALAIIEQIGLFSGQRAALSMAESAGNAASSGDRNVLIAAAQEVRASWDYGEAEEVSLNS